MGSWRRVKALARWLAVTGVAVSIGLSGSASAWACTGLSDTDVATLQRIDAYAKRWNRAFQPFLLGLHAGNAGGWVRRAPGQLQTMLSAAVGVRALVVKVADPTLALLLRARSGLYGAELRSATDLFSAAAKGDARGAAAAGKRLDYLGRVDRRFTGRFLATLHHYCAIS
jgi:hypothetical protein